MKQTHLINMLKIKSLLTVTMKHTSTSRRIAIMILLCVTLFLSSCDSDRKYLRYALSQAGDNRADRKSTRLNSSH